MNISGIGATPSATGGGSELQALFKSVAENLRQQESSIRNNLAEGLKPNGAVQKVPDHVRRQFEVWEATYTNPQDRALVEQLKKRVTEIVANQRGFIADQIDQKTTRAQLELAMRAVNKTTTGIQQLLSSQ